MDEGSMEVRPSMLSFGAGKISFGVILLVHVILWVGPAVGVSVMREDMDKGKSDAEKSITTAYIAACIIAPVVLLLFEVLRAMADVKGYTNRFDNTTYINLKPVFQGFIFGLGIFAVANGAAAMIGAAQTSEDTLVRFQVALFFQCCGLGMFNTFYTEHVAAEN